MIIKARPGYAGLPERYYLVIAHANIARGMRHAARCGRGCGGGRRDHGDCPPVLEPTPTHRVLAAHGARARSHLQAYLAIRRGLAMSIMCDEALEALGKRRRKVIYIAPPPRKYKLMRPYRPGEPNTLVEVPMD